jgi:2-methylcitrate dehydratase PrpD
MGATEAIAAFITGASAKDLPAGVRDGRTDRIRVDKAPGAPARDLSWDELRMKFMDCARHAPRVPEKAAEHAFELIRKLDQLDDIGHVVELLR